METVALIVYLSRYILSAVAAVSCILLSRRTRRLGWLILGTSFLADFWFLAVRAVCGRPLLTYRKYGPVVDGVAQMNIRIEIPYFGILAAIGLLLLLRSSKENKDTLRIRS